MLPEILGRWYTQKQRSQFCLFLQTGNWKACGNMHRPSMPHFYFSSKWFCPLVPKNTSAKNEKSKCKRTRDILDEALKLDFSCTCKQKPLCLDKLLKCHNPSCQSGKFFHLPCLNFKRMPNNAMTTWECLVCKSEEKLNKAKKLLMILSIHLMMVL